MEKDAVVPRKDKPDKSYPGFKDVIGQDKAVKMLYDACLAHNNRQIFEYMGVGSPKGVLMYGDPGTGKSFLAHAFANESDSFFYQINTANIGSSYINATANNLADAHEKAVSNSIKLGLEGRVVLFLDECENILGKRNERTNHKEDDKVVNVACELMDGGMSDPRVLFIAATNRKEMIDPAFLRAGRFDYHVEFSKPDKTALMRLYEHYSKNVLVRKDGSKNFKRLDYEELADLSHGFVGADVAFVLKETVRRYVFSQIRKVKKVVKIGSISTKHVKEVILDHKLSRCYGVKEEVCRRIGF